MSMKHLAEEDGMFAMMMDIHCINVNLCSLKFLHVYFVFVAFFLSVLFLNNWDWNTQSIVLFWNGYFEFYLKYPFQFVFIITQVFFRWIIEISKLDYWNIKKYTKLFCIVLHEWNYNVIYWSAGIVWGLFSFRSYQLICNLFDQNQCFCSYIILIKIKLNSFTYFIYTQTT